MDKIKSYILSVMKDERKTIDSYIIGALLSIASAVYLLILNCVYFLYRNNILRPHKVRAKVISVGNITLGGTGKTPFTIAFAENIKAMGRKPAVLTRGYGGDESHLLKERLQGIPVLVGRDRVKNAKRAQDEFGNDSVILDDGFQHYRIKKDLNIVLIDATSPFGNGRLFPRGILREPLTRLKDADIVILTKSDMGRNNIDYIRGVLRKFNEKFEIIESFYQPIDLRKIFSQDATPLSYIKDKKVAILAGIANPDYFSWLVERLGAEIVERFYYTDHYPYREKDMASVAEKCLNRNTNLLITTEKDAVRLKRLKSLPSEIEIFALRIDSRISSNEEAVVAGLHSIFDS